VLLPADTSATIASIEREDAQHDPRGRTASVSLSDAEARLLDAIRKTDGGLTGSDAAQILHANRLWAGHVLKALRRLRLITKQGRHYILRKDAR
jgi:hypothetical protein